MADAVRVLELTDATGLYAGRLLAWCGAEVIRVEPPGGDPLRRMPPFVDDRPGECRSLVFGVTQSGKKSVVLDAGTPAGRTTLLDLAARVDLVLFSGSAAHFDEVGLAAALAAPGGPVVTAVTPFGLTGPLRHWVGSDLVAWASSGLLSTIGDPDRPPVVPGGSLSYAIAGQVAVVASLAALRARRRQGVGQLVDVSLQEAVAGIGGECAPSVFLDDLILRRRSGNRRRTGAPFGLFEAADGYVAVLALMAEHWLALRQWIFEVTGNDAVLSPIFEGGAQSRAGDLWDVVNLFTEDLTKRLPKATLFAEGQRRGIPITPVNDAAAAAEDPQLEARGYWDVADLDGRQVRVPGPPFRGPSLGPGPGGGERVPRPGEHTEEVLGTLLDAAVGD
jgi:benzylsuccinate CoA-transferase BbsE subunit